jgi:hypothetical protein
MSSTVTKKLKAILFIYLLIYDLFTDAVSNWDYTASNDRNSKK